MDTLGSLIQLGPVKASPAVREVSRHPKHSTSVFGKQLTKIFNYFFWVNSQMGEAEWDFAVRRRGGGGKGTSCLCWHRFPLHSRCLL